MRNQAYGANGSTGYRQAPHGTVGMMAKVCQALSVVGTLRKLQLKFPDGSMDGTASGGRLPIL